MKLLQTLVDKCGGSVTVEINEHRDIYQTVENYLKNDQLAIDTDISSEIREQMISTDTIVACQFYPRTPVSFFKVFHVNFEKCLKQCLEILDNL